MTLKRTRRARLSVADLWIRAVLGRIYSHPGITRSEIAHAARLNPGSVSRALQELLAAGTVQKTGQLRSTGGRKSDALKLNPDAGFFVAADLEGSRVRFGLTNLVGDVRFRWEEALEAGGFSFDRVIRGIRLVMDRAGEGERTRVLAVGISYTGLMDAAGLLTAVNLGWSRVRLSEEIERACGLPVFVGGDTSTGVLVEHALGVARGYNDCIYLSIGNGVGIGCLVNGELLRGKSGLAGEFGHIVMEPGGSDRCNCGKTGCLEAIASSPNIVRRYRELSAEPGSLAVEEVFERARDGDPAAQEAVGRAARYLGLGLSYLANILNPGLIVLGGDLLHGHDLMLPTIEEQLRCYALAGILEGLELKLSSLGSDIGLKAAASLAFRHALEDSRLLRRLAGGAGSPAAA